MSWYAVTRRYRVEDIVYVRANNAEEAKRVADEGEWEGQTDIETVGRTTFPRAERRAGPPRWLWEEMGEPDDVVIQT